MAALRELFAKFTTEFETGPLVQGAAAVDGLFGKLQGLASALAGTAIIGGVAAFTHKVIEQGDAMITTAERLGLNTQALQQWTYVADLADVGAEEFAGSLKILQKNLFDAAQGGGDSAANFAKVGLSLEDLKKGDLDLVLTKAADGFAALKNPIEKTALAQKLFGRSGTALVPLLSKGAAGVAELKREFEELGGGLNDETLAAANDADDAFKRLRFSMRSLLSNAVLPLIQLAIIVAKKLTEVVRATIAWTKGTNAVKAAVVALAIVGAAMATKILIAFAPLIASTLAWAAVIAIAILAIDEIITTLEGGDSVLRRWIDDTYGAGATDEVIKALKEAWDELVPALKEAWIWLKDNIIPTASTLSNIMRQLGADIAFVVDQFRALFSGEFVEGIKKIGHDIGVKLGVSDETADEKKLKHGAEGFFSQSAANTAQGIANGATRGGADPFVASLTRFAGDAGTRASASPAFIGPPAPPGMQITNAPVINVAANAKPDPTLTAHVKKAVQEGLDEQNRKALAAVQGS